jgi:putative membrane protein
VWWLIICGTIAWRRVSTQYAFTVAVSPDGVRIRRGLLGTVAETIPVPRIQAVRMIEPLLWRPLHWCRLEVDVAGHLGRDHPEGSGAVRKALLPVGRPDEARRLLAIALPAATGWPALRKPPRRSWWKAPLSYHFLAAGHDGTLAVAVVGRLRRETTWVPLAKAQSVRLVQGPLQRRLGLATVHLDAAGRRVRAEFRERRQDEARSLVDELAALSRSARRQASLAAAGPPVPPPAGDAGQAASVASPVNASQSET